jgi:multidrug efflux pump subunit AcrA (membrane-fusion protein)
MTAPAPGAPRARPSRRATSTSFTGLFRAEAVEAARQGARPGVPLAIASRWMGLAYWLLVAVAAVGLVFVLVARVGEYARGPAVVRVEGRLDLTSAFGGVVLAIDVRAGQAVQPGQLLVQFHAPAERQELEQLERDFELALVRILLRPGDEATRHSLASLRAARELAASRLGQRQVVAPQAGVVRNLRIRPGQLLAPGDVVLTLVDEARASFSLVALVPGQFRPMLEPGKPLRFTLQGYPQVAARLVIDSVGDEAVGPAEARRFLGPELEDTLPVASDGSLVLVRARLPAATFALDGRRYRFYDGLPGRADIEVRRVPLGALLFPALKELWPDGR